VIRWVVPAVIAAAACTRRPPPRSHAVTIQNFALRPATLTVSVGDTIVWTNADFVPHTATARDGAWDSKSIDGSGTWRFVARAPGRHAYYCVFHPNMQGTIEVR
jgi:plastocyanin